MVFSTETRVSMRIYLHLTKFNLVKDRYAEMTQRLNVALPGWLTGAFDFRASCPGIYNCHLYFLLHMASL